jgi:hypothetical protein
MATIYLSYLFDSYGFLEVMKPIVSSIEREDSKPLISMARSIMETQPSLWAILDSLNLGKPFIDEEEIPSLRRMVTMVMSKFLDPIDETQVAWRVLDQALPFVNWNEEQTELLLYGRSPCELFNIHSIEMKINRYEVDGLRWCDGHLGWLGKEDAMMLQEKLESSLHKLIELPNELGNDELAELSSSIGCKQGQMTYLLEESYQFEMKLLTRAISSHKALAMSLA